MTESFLIRQAELRDLDDCIAINAENFHIFDRSKRRQHFQQMIPRQNMLVLEVNGKIQAYATFDPDWFGCTFLKLVVVSSKVRRQGLAAALIQEIERKHCPSGRFFSSTEDDNEISKAMHRKLGFTPGGYLDHLPQPHREIFYFKSLVPQSSELHPKD